MAVLRRLVHDGSIQVLRLLPVPARAKQALVWLLSPRHEVAALAIIRDEHDRVLVLLSAWLRRWQLPGGAVQLHETPLAALRREVQEETGRRVARATRPTVVVGGTISEVLFVYRVTLAPGALHLSTEHTAWTYCPRSALPPEVARLVTLGLQASYPRQTGP